MFTVDLTSGGRTKALHAVIRASEQERAQSINCQVRPNIELLDFCATSLVNFNQPGTLAKGAKPRYHGDVKEKRDEREPSCGESAYSPSMEAVRVAINPPFQGIKQGDLSWRFDLCTAFLGNSTLVAAEASYEVLVDDISCV